MATTRKPRNTAEAEVREPENCMNCGAEATYRTTNPGATVRYFCDGCASKAYPEPAGYLEAL